MPCVYGDTILHLKEVLNIGYCGWRVMFNLLFCFKQKKITENKSLQLQISRLVYKLSLSCYITMPSFQWIRTLLNLLLYSVAIPQGTLGTGKEKL